MASAPKIYEASVRSGSIAAGATFNMIFTCNANPVVFLNRIVGFGGAGAVANVYRFPAFTGGTLVPNYSMDTTAFGSTAQVLSGATVSVTGGLVAAPTYYRGTTSPGPGVVGTYGTTSGQRRLAPYNQYLLQFTNNDAGAQTFDVYLRWAETVDETPGAI